MSLLDDVYTAYLAGLTEKTGNEIHWVDEVGIPITVESLRLKTKRYTVRYYDKESKKIIKKVVFQDDAICSETYYSHRMTEYAQYKNGLLHGRRIIRYEDGRKTIRQLYKNGVMIK